MNERIRHILTLLIKKPEIKMAELTEQLRLTRRQINYSINQFNEELQLKSMPQIKRNHAGDFLIPLEVLTLLTKTSDVQNQMIYSENERSALLLVFLITNTDYVSLDHLTELLAVSKNTVLEDLRRGEWLVGKYDLVIDYDRQSGYQLKGAEHRILQLLSDLVKQTQLLRNGEMKEKLAATVSEEETIHLIHNMEQMLQLSYSDESIDYLQAAVRFLLQRGSKNTAVITDFFKGNVQDNPEYKLLSVLIQDSLWEINQSYLEWLTLLFLTSNIFERKTTQEFDSDNELRKLIHQMVENFQSQTLIVIKDREVFERRILSHLRPACFRIKYSLSLGVYSLDSLIQDSNHAILNELMKELIVPTENWLGKAFPSDELELLSYYFGFQLASPRTGSAQKPRAVVVCANGVMVSKLMRENLEKLFTELHFLASFSVRDFYKFGADYDLVFTTTPLRSSIVQFIIDPIMTYKEQISLRYRVLKELGLNKVDNSVDELLQIIRKYTVIEDGRELREELEYFLLREKQDSPLENFKTLPDLTQYLKPSFITIVEESMHWEAALDLACKPLLENQIIQEEFVLDCKRQIAAAGYTGFLGTQTCIPHTTPEHGVLKDGISLLVSKQPIQFPGGRSIHFVFPLSFYDLTKHLKAVNQLADISNNQELLQKLVTVDDEKTMYQFLRQYT